MTSNNFIGPDGRAYPLSKPEEGGFLSYFDGRAWLITFPLRENPDRAYCYDGEHLPTAAGQWKLRLVHAHGRHPACTES